MVLSGPIQTPIGDLKRWWMTEQQHRKLSDDAANKQSREQGAAGTGQPAKKAEQCRPDAQQTEAGEQQLVRK